MFITWFGRSPRIDVDTGTPVGINVAVGAVTISMAMVAAATVPITDPQWRCAPVAVAMGLFAAGTFDWRAVALIVVPAWMVMNGFLVNHLGELSWHGWADLDRFLVLVVAGGVGLAVASAHRGLKDRRERWPLGAAVHEMRREINEETKQRA